MTNKNKINSKWNYAKNLTSTLHTTKTTHINNKIKKQNSRQVEPPRIVWPEFWNAEYKGSKNSPILKFVRKKIEECEGGDILTTITDAKA